MKKQIFLPVELVDALRVIATHDGFVRIAALMRVNEEGALALDEKEAVTLAHFAQYLQFRAEMRALNDDYSIDLEKYDAATSGLPDKLLSYLLSDFPSII